MGTTADDIKYSTMTRIAGQDEAAALDIVSEGGKYRAYVSSLERGTASIFGAKTVGVTEVALAISGAYANRRGILIQNLGAKDIYIGLTGVTTSTGMKISPQTSLWFSVSEAVVLYGISATAGQDVRVMEVA